MKGLIRSLSRGSPSRQDVVKQVVKVRSLALQVDGADDQDLTVTGELHILYAVLGDD